MLSYNYISLIIFLVFGISILSYVIFNYFFKFSFNENKEEEIIVNNINIYSKEMILRNDFEKKYNRKIDDNDIYLAKKYNNSIDFNILITWLISNEEIVNNNFNNSNDSLKCEEEMNNFNNEKYLISYRY